ncbi:HopJ type III effector protein [Psychrobacter sp. FDAARGOS_221]|uniref:HopJ type III effector protein n=1 Tax=Psychrobacter sp. FDAARGOS_221 TaxID=1975705 RepID=UPI000BB5675E|nr:HopJ type III effector protein [Psychrobacter sp. FDAARGOS_221]PNK59971.1 HopJ type III effector protein [Psychrobacter sp. FDAARGOS_221]
MGIRDSDVSALLNGLSKKAIGFNDVINFIDDFYRYTPVKFVNGDAVNEPGENEGSAKVFGFAKHHQLNQLDTLALFGEHYHSVLATPNGTDHANIRNFLHWGWQAFLMEKNPLTPRPSVDVKNI